MSERWIQSSEEILEQIKDLDKGKAMDRLELVRSMRFMLTALERSLIGWIQWMNNPDVMSEFTQEEMEEMNKTLEEFVRSFIEYDMKITKNGVQKGLPTERKPKRTSEREETVYI